jgi:predicted kinase
MALAPSIGAPPGAVVIRSDEIRKKLCGVKPVDRLGPEGYTDAMSRRVYRTLMEQADKVVRGGCAAIADAVFATSADRDAVQHVAVAAGVPFAGLWLEAPEPILIARVDRRRRDVSDAGADVVRRQRAQPLEPPHWRSIDASGDRRSVCAAATSAADVDQRVLAH